MPLSLLLRLWLVSELVVSFSLISFASLASCCLRNVRVLFFACCCAALAWGGYDFDWLRMSSVSGAVILSHAE